MRAHLAARLVHYNDVLGGHHNRGSTIVPFSMHNVDEPLDNLGLNLSAVRRAKQWVDPIKAAS